MLFVVVMQICRVVYLRNAILNSEDILLSIFNN